MRVLQELRLEAECRLGRAVVSLLFFLLLPSSSSLNDIKLLRNCNIHCLGGPISSVLTAHWQAIGIGPRDSRRPSAQCGGCEISCLATLSFNHHVLIMAAPFSWSDTVKITFGSCMPCLQPTAEEESASEDHNPAINRIPRARPDELQGLLADPDTDGEAETMSLHSNPGRGQRNRNKKKRKSKKSSDNPRRITLFGYDLFGRPPPVHLPNDSEDAFYSRRSSLTPSAIVTTHSTASTFDSDAAPLDADAIAALSSPTTAPAALEAAVQAAAAAEVQRLKEKEERRQRRKEKKERKRLADALAHQGVVDQDAEFEGFQGSGDQALPPRSDLGYPRMSNGIVTGSDSGSGSVFSGSGREGFGGFVSAPPHAAPGPYTSYQDDEDDAADLDGGLYSRKTPRGGSNGGSDSRSRTSASMSDRAHQIPDPRHVLAHLHSQPSNRVNSPSRPNFNQPPSALEPAKKAKSKSSSSRTSKSRSSATTSQSPSIASPASPGFPAEVQEIVSPSTVEQGQGFFDLEDEIPTKKPSAPTTDFPSARLGGGGGFPSTGFGGSNGARRTKDFGAFLAHRGDEAEETAGF